MIDLVRYRDPELEALRAKVRSLEVRVRDLIQRKATMLDQIVTFCDRQLHELTPLSTRLCELRLQRLRRAKESSPEDEAIAEALATTQRLLEQLRQRAPRKGLPSFVFEPPGLSREEEAELRQTFKEALRMCHPDAVPPALKERAEKICKALVSAYQHKNLLAVQDILLQLKTEGVGGAKVPPPETARAWLDRRLGILSERLAAEEELVEKIEATKSYRTASGIPDWDAWFAAAREKLEAQIEAERALQDAEQPGD